MKKSSGYIADCLVTECPYCKEEVIEVGFALNDLTAPDMAQMAEEPIECNHCHKEFVVELEE